MSKKEAVSNQKSFSRFFNILKERVKISEFTTYSIVVAYYLLLSLFPLLITVGNILPFLSIDPDSVLPYIQEIIPSTIYRFLGPAIEDLLTQSSGGLLSISAITTIWSASKSINALQKAMNKSLNVEQRTGIVARILSVLVLIVFLFAMVGLSLVIGAGQVLLDAIQPIFQIPDAFLNIFQTVKWPLTFVALFLLMAIIYWMVPNIKMKIRAVLPGAVFATVGWMLLSQVFGLYARYFATTVSGYQIIGSFVVLMLWLNFAAMIIILGSVLNASMVEFYNGKLQANDASDK